MSASFDEILKKRRSVRKFDDSLVSGDDLKAIVEAGTLAPSGMHRDELCFVGLTKDYAKRYLSASKTHFGMDRYYGANTVILVLRDLSKSALHDLDIGAAMENMLLKATDLNLQTCWIHAAVDLADDDEVKDLLKELGYSPDSYRLMESIAVGHGQIPGDKEVDESRAKVF